MRVDQSAPGLIAQVHLVLNLKSLWFCGPPSQHFAARITCWVRGKWARQKHGKNDAHGAKHALVSTLEPEGSNALYQFSPDGALLAPGRPAGLRLGFGGDRDPTRLRPALHDLRLRCRDHHVRRHIDVAVALCTAANWRGLHVVLGSVFIADRYRLLRWSIAERPSLCIARILYNAPPVFLLAARALDETRAYQKTTPTDCLIKVVRDERLQLSRYFSIS